MPFRPTSLVAWLWLPLAAWLALWPAVEARVSPPRLPATSHVRKSPPRGGSGCHMRAAKAGLRSQGGGCHGCCADRDGGERRAPACPEQGSSRCGQCFGTNGLLLAAHVLSMPDPERPELGSIRHGDLVAASRDLRPPEPPPRATPAILFA